MQVAEPAATSVSRATSYPSCASGSVVGLKSTVCTLHKHFLCPVCCASESRRFFSSIMGEKGPSGGSVGHNVPVLAAKGA